MRWDVFLRKLPKIAELEVPAYALGKKTQRALEEKGFSQLLKEAEEHGIEWNEEQRKKIRKYVENIPKTRPPDIQGTQFTPFKLYKLVQDYWEKVVRIVDANKTLKEEAEKIFLTEWEELKEITFHASQLMEFLAHKVDPDLLKKPKAVIGMILIKIGIEEGKIGKVRKGEELEVFQKLIDEFLKGVATYDVEESYKFLKQVLKGEKVRDREGEKG